MLFVDAPVSGSKGPAETGELLILASGPPAAVPVAGPAFAAMGRRTVWLGEAGQGSQMKLAVNAYMSILIEGVAEALELAERAGRRGGEAGRGHRGRPAGRAHRRGQAAQDGAGRLRPEFPLEWALKDVDLAIGGARVDALPLLAALSRQWRAAVAEGHGREDVSAARLALRRDGVPGDAQPGASPEGSAAGGGGGRAGQGLVQPSRAAPRPGPRRSAG